MAKAADGTLTPFAGGTATFRVRGAASANRAAPAAAAPMARSRFSVAPLSSPAADPADLHDRHPAWGD